MKMVILPKKNLEGIRVEMLKIIGAILRNATVPTFGINKCNLVY